ncbi:hypothetical protein [Massilia niabensis]|uniref:Uncharacterized protein n=1 Tax=Massilia niabensis TaxID=544910 RepID=A0ABW0L302_9BURK
MTEPKPDTGFTLPAPQVAPAPAPGSSATDTAPLQLEVVPAQAPEQGPQPRDYAIGGGILFVLLLAFFFVRGAYANNLARKRVAPGQANAAGWYLFIFLASLATGSVLGFISPGKFMTPLVLAPIMIVALGSLVLMFISGRRA